VGEEQLKKMKKQKATSAKEMAKMRQQMES